MASQERTVPVDHVDGLSHIEIMGDGRGRFCLYENRRVADGKFIMVPKRDILMPLAALPDAITKSMAVSALEMAGKLYRFWPMSMH